MRALHAPTLSALCLALLGGHGALAQSTYSCPTGNGRYTYSNLPCPSVYYQGSQDIQPTPAPQAPQGPQSSKGSIVYYGPNSSPPPAPTHIPKVQDAPDHLKLLGPRCSSMSDAIRTGPARGLKSETLAALHKEYRRECAEEESQAIRKLSSERSDARRHQQEEQKAQAQAQALQQQRSQAAQQLCDESRRILATKKRRTDLNDGEKAELLRFEENFRSRCG